MPQSNYWDIDEILAQEAVSARARLRVVPGAPAQCAAARRAPVSCLPARARCPDTCPLARPAPPRPPPPPVPRGPAPPQRVPVQLRCAVPKKLMGCIEASSSSGEVKELPLWLAKGLHNSGYVDSSFPAAYKERSLQKMKAGASSLQLGQRYPYFYHLGTEVALLDNTQKGYEVLETLQEAFAMRYKEILDRFHNTGEHAEHSAHACHLFAQLSFCIALTGSRASFPFPWLVCLPYPSRLWCGARPASRLLLPHNCCLLTSHPDVGLDFSCAEDKGAGKYLAKLTKSEQALYLCGKESCLHHSSWRRRQMEVIEESHISRMTKRQRY